MIGLIGEQEEEEEQEKEEEEEGVDPLTSYSCKQRLIGVPLLSVLRIVSYPACCQSCCQSCCRLVFIFYQLSNLSSFSPRIISVTLNADHDDDDVLVVIKLTTLSNALYSTLNSATNIFEPPQLGW